MKFLCLLSSLILLTQKHCQLPRLSNVVSPSINDRPTTSAPNTMALVHYYSNNLFTATEPTEFDQQQIQSKN